jgi:hypothetical protein
MENVLKSVPRRFVTGWDGFVVIVWARMREHAAITRSLSSLGPRDHACWRHSAAEGDGVRVGSNIGAGSRKVLARAGNGASQKMSGEPAWLIDGCDEEAECSGVVAVLEAPNELAGDASRRFGRGVVGIWRSIEIGFPRKEEPESEAKEKSERPSAVAGIKQKAGGQTLSLRQPQSDHMTPARALSGANKKRRSGFSVEFGPRKIQQRNVEK